MDNKRDKTVNNLIWRFMERCGASMVSFVVSIILARLLAPSDYGTIALVTVFTSILNVFVDSGLGNALIQKENADDLDFSSVFYFNVVTCSLLYVLMFFLAPLIAEFYGKSELIPVVRVLSLTIVISSIKNVQQAYVSRNLIFKKFFWATISGTMISAVVGIVLAYLGFGVWALVAQQLTNATIDTIVLWVTVKWRPICGFSIARMKILFGFGWKLLASSLLNTIYNELRQLLIGKVYTSEDLAFYNRGRQMPSIVVTNINTSIDSVLFPVMSSVQNNRNSMKNIIRRSIQTSSYIMMPLMLGLAVVSEPLIHVLLGEAWTETVPFMQISCIVFCFEPIQTANLNAIKAIGRSDIFFKLEVIKKSTGILILLSVVRYGVMAIALSGVVYTIFASVVNSYPNYKLLGYPYIEQLKDILPNIICSVIMAGMVYLISMIEMPDILLIAVQVCAGGIIYIALSFVFKLESFNYILGFVKDKLKKG